MGDIALLKEHTSYHDCTASDNFIQLFWDMMENRFNNKEREQFLAFVWGRRRLPLKGASWGKNFTINAKRLASQTTLPVAHTCFFSIDLPLYNDIETMMEKIRYA